MKPQHAEMPAATFAAIRQNLGLSQEEMGARLVGRSPAGITARSIRNFESGAQGIRPEIAEEALDLLQQHIEEVEGIGAPEKIVVARGDHWSLAVAAQVQRLDPHVVIEWSS